MVSSEDSRIFIWKDFREWKSALEGMFGDILTTELKVKAKQNATRIEYCDDRIECEKLIGQSIEDMITMQKINEIRQLYSHIRVYHACRPTDVQSYYDKGLLLCDKNVLVNHFREIFLSGDYPELTEEMLQKSIEEAAPYSVGNDGELCLAIDYRHLIKYCGHYLIYGSEYLSGLLTHLPIESIGKYDSALREIGKPTIFKINLPNMVANVSDSVIYSVLERMITEWLYMAGHPREMSCNFDCTLSFRKPIQSEHICSHFHPVEIPDPSTGYKIYDTETGEYEDKETE